ncbi:MAG: carotenoid oxygenase family protein, partial [Halobacteria archaeon]|nr:carotenoid oxygenase family protein [Halobacteria archaeon]
MAQEYSGSQSSRGRQLGFTTLDEEVQNRELQVEGDIPDWVNGALLRNGPAKFEDSAKSFNHWFDGMAMLRRFSIRNGRVEYSNKFLESKAYESVKNGEMAYDEFATDPCRDIFERFFTLFKGPNATDNANVNIARHADDFVAMTETPIPIEFDPETLETIGEVEYTESDAVDGDITTAHPHYDFERGETVNYVTEFSRKSEYKVYTLADSSDEREILGTYGVDEPAYMHSFGMTENYVVLAEF